MLPTLEAYFVEIAPMIKVHVCKKCRIRWIPVVLKPPAEEGGPPLCPACGGEAPEEKVKR